MSESTHSHSFFYFPSYPYQPPPPSPLFQPAINNMNEKKTNFKRALFIAMVSLDFGVIEVQIKEVWLYFILVFDNF